MTRQEEITLARLIDLRETLDKFEDKALIQLKKTYTDAQGIIYDRLMRSKKTALALKERLAALKSETIAMQGAVAATLTGEVSKVIAEAGAFSYKKMNDITSWDGKVKKFNNVILSPAQITQLVTEQTLNGKVLKDWIGSALAPDLEKIEEVIKTGAIMGDGYAATVKRLAKDLAVDNTKQLRDLETVVKTYNQSMAVKAQRDVYRGNKEVVEQVEWTAILEAGNVKTGRGTCPRCIALDGMKWALDDTNVPSCPLHARCRCLLLPVTKTWKELGFDIDEMEKQYSPWFVKDENGNKIESGRTQQSYHEWFASRDKAFQDRAIGPTRAALFREGKLKLVEMVDQKGNLINVDKLGVVPSVKGSKPSGGGSAPLASASKPAPKPKVPKAPKIPKETGDPITKTFSEEHKMYYTGYKKQYLKWMQENKKDLKDPMNREDLLWRFYGKEFPNISRCLQQWQIDTNDSEPMGLRMRYLLQEKGGDTSSLIIRKDFLEGSGKTRQQYIEMLKKDADFYAPKIEYLRMRAFNQAYLEHIGYNENEWLYRGTDGNTGRSAVEGSLGGLLKEAEKTGAVPKFDYVDREIAGYTSRAKIATSFGNNSGGYAVRIKVKKEEMFLHRDLLSGATGAHVDEEEFLILSRAREVSLEDITWAEKRFGGD
jgi:hypothetical protein